MVSCWSVMAPSVMMSKHAYVWYGCGSARTLSTVARMTGAKLVGPNSLRAPKVLCFTRPLCMPPSAVAMVICGNDAVRRAAVRVHAASAVKCATVMRCTVLHGL